MSITPSIVFDFVRGKQYAPPIVMGTESLMKKKAHGSTEKPVQKGLKWGVDQKKADKICCFNRHYAEHSGYFKKTSWVAEMRAREDENAPFEYYDSVSGKLLFTAPINRTFNEFLAESTKHGWPSFRDDEVNWENVRVLPGGETVSIWGTHLGHNLPDKKGNRYCINLVCVAGNKVDGDVPVPVAEPDEVVFELKKDGPGCTGLFFRSNPHEGAQVVSKYKDWPRDNAHISGTVETVNGEQWLKVSKVKQPGKKKFSKVKGKDVWIPFRHHQHFLEAVDADI